LLTPKFIPGIEALSQKKSILGFFANENLNPVGDKKLLFEICLSQDV